MTHQQQQQTEIEDFARHLRDDFFEELHREELIYAINTEGDMAYATEFQGVGGGFEPTFMRKSIEAWDDDMSKDYKEETGRDLDEDAFGQDSSYNHAAWEYTDRWRADLEEASYAGVTYEAHFDGGNVGHPYIDFSCNYRKEALRYYITEASLQKNAREIDALATHLVALLLHSPSIREVYENDYT